MKTHKVRPILVSQEKATWPNCLWLGRQTGKLHLDHSYDDKPKSINPIDSSMLPQQLILILLEDEKIEVGDICEQDGGLVKITCNRDASCRNLKKVIATQSQLSPELIQQLVDEYNNGSMKDFEIEMEEYFNESIGDKIKVKNIVYGFNPGDIITIKQFNYNGDCNLVAFEEDDEFQQGFHIFHLELTTRFELKLTNGFVTPIKKEPILYTEKEVKKLTYEAMFNENSDWSFPDKYFENWFNQNKKK